MDYDGRGILGHLAASEVWLGVTDTTAEGTFTQVTDSGIRCITTPCCNTLHEAKLNSFLSADLSEIYLDGTGATEEQKNDAYATLYAETGLIVSGYRYWFYDGDWQAGRYITQFFQPVVAPGSEDE